jgi:hypothetical protein
MEMICGDLQQLAGYGDPLVEDQTCEGRASHGARGESRQVAEQGQRPADDGQRAVQVGEQVGARLLVGTHTVAHRQRPDESEVKVRLLTQMLLWMQSLVVFGTLLREDRYHQINAAC